MWQITIPSCTAAEAYRRCSIGLRDQDLKDRLDRATPEIRNADIRYQSAGAIGQFAGMSAAQFQLSLVTVAEMSWLYDQKMVTKRSPGRAIYDMLRLSTKNGRCPLCGHGQVMTLDHYLPKATFSALAVNPANLIPSCSDCNKAKSSSVNATIHSYFDNIEDERWLYARVDEVFPAAVDFFVKAPEGWPSGLGQRVSEHFRLFGLRALYAAQAAHVLSEIKLRLINLYADGGAEAVQFYLVEEANSRRGNTLNSWQTALYESLSESAWFCDTGFKLE